MKKLAIVSTHPIQYNAPWFRLITQREKVDIKVFYTWSQAQEEVVDKTFGLTISWDIPLMEGYSYKFVKNIAKDPGVHHFYGINCPDLVSEILDYEPTAILVFGWNFKSHFAVMRYFKGKTPVWFRGDSTLLDENKNFKTVLRRGLLKFIYRYIDKALYVGKANKEYFMKHGLKQEQLFYVPHAIDNDRFAETNEKSYLQKAANWRDELGISKEDIVVLFAGKFEWKKQPDMLIRAVEQINQKNNLRVNLILLGSGEMEKTLKNRAKNADHVHILPFQNQSMMPIVYRLGNIFCLPSRGPGETWGLAVNEAMASGIPAIVSNKVGCSEDIIKEGENGYIFKYDNLRELKDIIESMTLDKLSSMGKRANEFIQDWNFRTIAESIENKL